MLPEIKSMQRVEELESDIRKLEGETKDLRAQIEQVEKDRARRQSILARLKTQVQDVMMKRTGLEGDLQVQEQKLQKFQKQQNSVQTSKELEAITHQIDQAQAEASRLEEGILTAMELEEQSSRELTEKTAASQRLDAKAEEQLGRLATSADEKDTLLKGLREDRIAAWNQIEPRLRAECEYLFKRHGNFIAEVRGEACSGCGGILVPELAIRARSQQALVQCTHCQRYLLGASSGN